MELLRSQEDLRRSAVRGQINNERKYVEDTINKRSVQKMVHKQVVDERRFNQMRQDTQLNKKPFRWPFDWNSKAQKSKKNKDHVLIFYLTIKGELETFVVPIYSGHMVIIKNKVYEVDPRAMWTANVGLVKKKTYKLLIIKEIDRRPVSNLDLDEIRRRGDATDSDEFLIKAALRAQTVGAMKQIPKGLIIIGAVVVIGLVAFLIWKGG
jgi:hypothetical protein